MEEGVQLVESNSVTGVEIKMVMEMVDLRESKTETGLGQL